MDRHTQGIDADEIAAAAPAGHAAQAAAWRALEDYSDALRLRDDLSDALSALVKVTRRLDGQPYGRRTLTDDAHTRLVITTKRVMDALTQTICVMEDRHEAALRIRLPSGARGTGGSGSA
jgi:hypothetical protein